jgi:hypothetical protein
VTRPPSGAPPPRQATLADGTVVELGPLAEAVCDRYQAEFPDEQERYGPAGRAWCIHDNLHIFAWAISDAEFGYVRLTEKIAWLARVLDARDFPLERLVRDLEIARDVLLAAHPQLEPTASLLGSAAADLRTQGVRGVD